MFHKFGLGSWVIANTSSLAYTDDSVVAMVKRPASAAAHNNSTAYQVMTSDKNVLFVHDFSGRLHAHVEP